MAANTMVVGYLRSGEGDDALALTRVLAGAIGLQPTVASVFPWTGPLLGIDDLRIAVREETEQTLERVREKLAPLEPDIHSDVVTSPALALEDLATDVDARLIVIGSTHHGAVGQTLLGSLGESLLTDAPCAVAIAPRGYATAERDRGLRRIAVGFDGSPESWTALETAIGIARRCHSSLMLITVADFPHYGYASAWAALSLSDYHDLEREEREKTLELGLGRVPDSIAVDGEIVTGLPGAVLAERSPDFDLLIVGSRGYGSLRRTILGSSTRKLLRASSCPVLVTPRGAGTDPLRLDEGGGEAVRLRSWRTQETSPASSGRSSVFGPAGGSI